MSLIHTNLLIHTIKNAYILMENLLNGSKAVYAQQHFSVVNVHPYSYIVRVCFKNQRISKKGIHSKVVDSASFDIYKRHFGLNTILLSNFIQILNKKN